MYRRFLNLSQQSQQTPALASLGISNKLGKNSSIPNRQRFAIFLIGTLLTFGISLFFISYKLMLNGSPWTKETPPPTPPPWENITDLVALNIPLFTMGGAIGGTCNQMHTISLGVSKAVEAKGLLIVWGPYKRIFEQLDLEYMKTNYPQLNFVLRDNQPQLGGYDGWAGVACGLRHSYDWIKHGVRPKKEFREQAENGIAELRREAAVTVAVRLRYFEDLCNREGDLTRLSWLQDGRPCHRNNQDYVVDANRICRYRLDQDLVNTLEQEWPELKQAQSFGAFVSTDDQRPNYNLEFFDKNYAKQFRFLSATRSPPSTNMLVDMWAATMADYYVGNPMSSCEPIITQWRGSMKGKEGKVYPTKCFSGFESPQIKLDPAVYGPC
jgi:hypothetical protein